MSDRDYFAVQPLLMWLCKKRDEADENCDELADSTHFYWLGKWAAFRQLMEFIEKGE